MLPLFNMQIANRVVRPFILNSSLKSYIFLIMCKKKKK